MPGPALSKNKDPDFKQSFLDGKTAITRSNHEWLEHVKDNPLLGQTRNPWESEAQHIRRTQKTPFDHWEAKNAHKYPTKNYNISI